jgi:hypothetical protein
MKKISLILFATLFIFITIFLLTVEINKEKIIYNDGPYYFVERDSTYKKILFKSYNNSKNNEPSIEIIEEEINENTEKNKIILKANFKQENYIFKNKIDSIFCVGDVHGEYDGLISLLKNNNIIDKDLNWSFGKGHLIFCGDLFDRGEMVNETLLFIYNLENQASGFGGKVHVILGNHEIMIFDGNTKYVNSKYDYINRTTNISYNYLYNKDNSLIGKWLRSKPVILKIEDKIFVHGGISPDFIKSGYSINYTNDLIYNYLNFNTFNKDLKKILGVNGPLWFRGYLETENNPISDKDILKILNHLDANNVIFAHTKVKNVEFLFKNKLIAIDVPLTKHYSEGLLIIGNKYKVVDNNGTVINEK